MIKYAAFLTAAAAISFAALGDVTASFLAPAPFPLAIEKGAADNALYIFSNTPPYLIWRTHALTGAVVASYPSPRGTTTRGLSWLGTDLIVGDDYNHYVYRFAAATGSVYGSWPAGHDVQGLATDGLLGSGSRVFATSIYPYNRVWSHTTAGSVVASFEVDANTDCAWDYVNDLVWVNCTEDNYVKGFNIAGSLISSFAAPANVPWGLAFYGGYLWVGTTSGTHRIWRIHCPAFTSITPASLGRVKAIYQ